MYVEASSAVHTPGQTEYLHSLSKHLYLKQTQSDSSTAKDSKSGGRQAKRSEDLPETVRKRKTRRMELVRFRLFMHHACMHACVTPARVYIHTHTHRALPSHRSSSSSTLSSLLSKCRASCYVTLALFCDVKLPGCVYNELRETSQAERKGRQGEQEERRRKEEPHEENHPRMTRTYPCLCLKK